MNSALYNRDILRLAATLIVNDRLENPDGTAEVRSPVCGSRMQADIRISPGGSISAIALRANACALGQASAAILRTHAVGASLAAITVLRSGIAEGLSGRADMPTSWPELQLLAPARDYSARHAAILLPYDAVIAAAAQLRLAS